MIIIMIILITILMILMTKITNNNTKHMISMNTNNTYKTSHIITILILHGLIMLTNITHTHTPSWLMAVPQNMARRPEGSLSVTFKRIIV